MLDMSLSSLAQSSILAFVLPATAVSGQVRYSVDFDSPIPTGYLIQTITSVSPNLPDGTVEFDYNYLADGIGLAPNSDIFGGRGLRITANETEPPAADAYSVFFTSPISDPQYRVSVDMYMGIELGANGTTEFSSIGIGSDGTVVNTTFGPTAGDGHYLSMTGDGESSSDYRHFTPALSTVPSGHPSYLDPSKTTNASGVLYQSILPGGDFPGSPGNRWVTLTVDVTPAFVTYAINGTDIIRTANEDSVGYVSLGYADLFTSVGPHFVVFDNLSVAVQSTIVDASIRNGDFETGLLSPWDDSGNLGLASLSTVITRSGNYSLVIDSTGAPAWSSPGVGIADIPAAEGDIWELSGYLLTPAPIADASFGLLKIVFTDVDGNELIPTEITTGRIVSDPAFPGIETVPRLDSSAVAGNWIAVNASGIAPPGTASVTLLALNVNEGVAPGEMYFDSLVVTRTSGELPVTPAPIQPAIQIDGMDVLLKAETNSTLEYTVETSSDLSEWSPVAKYSGNDQSPTVRLIGTRPGSGLKRFYQIAYGPPAPPLGVDVLVNGDFSQGIDNLSGWEAYAIWEQPKGSYALDGPWALADAPVSASGGVASFAMNTQLAGSDASWEGAYQNGMNFQQSFWTPDGPQSGNVVDLYGQTITFAGEIEVSQPYAENTLVDVQVQSSTLLPSQADQVYTKIVPSLITGSGTGCRFRLTRDATGAISAVKAIDPGSGFSIGDTILINGSFVGGVDGVDDVSLVVRELTDSTVEIFIEFLDGTFAPIAPSVSLDVTSQGFGPKPFSLQATCPPGGLNVVVVGFRHRGIEGTVGRVSISNVSLTAAP